MKSALRVKRTELRIKLPKTTRKKRAGEGMRARRDEGATFISACFGSLGSGVGRAFVLPDETRFRGDIFKLVKKSQTLHSSM